MSLNREIQELVKAAGADGVKFIGLEGLPEGVAAKNRLLTVNFYKLKLMKFLHDTCRHSPSDREARGSAANFYKLKLMKFLHDTCRHSPSDREARGSAVNFYKLKLMKFLHDTCRHSLSDRKARGSNQRYTKAVLFYMALSRDFILKFSEGLPTERDEYLEKEQAVEDLADRIAGWLNDKGFKAYSQSEKNNLLNGITETGYIAPEIVTGPSPVPQKTLACMSGMGFVGKNNLLVTKEYGCALAMCSVLTDAPLVADDPVDFGRGRREDVGKSGGEEGVEAGCGSCDACVKACKAGALLGNGWSREGGRDGILDRSKCCCALKCMVACPWTLRYAKGL